MSEALKNQDELWPNPYVTDAGQLASLVGARLCHDLISPLGAIGNGVELLQLTPKFAALTASPEMQLIIESVESVQARINWFRVAFGHAAADQRLGAGAMVELMAGADRQGRIRISYDAEGDLSRRDARLILLAVMCFETAMPWGGRVLICRGEAGWRLLAEAERMKLDPALWAQLEGRQSRGPARRDPEPSQVHFTLLAHFAADERRVLGYELDDSGGEISF